VIGAPTADNKTRTIAALNPTNRWNAAAWVVAVVVAGTAAVSHERIATDESPAAPVLSDSYPGLVRPRDVTTVALPAPVTVRDVRVAVGDRVSARQTLLVLDDEEARRTVTQLTFDAERAKEQRTQLESVVALLDRSIGALMTSLADANAQLAVAQRTAESVPNRQLKDSPARAQVAYDQALAREARLTELTKRGAVSRQDLEDARFATRVAADDLENAKRAAEASARLQSLQTVQARAQADVAVADQRRQRAERNGELEQARLRERQTLAALQAASDRLTDLTVRAPGDSIVADVGIKAGDRVLAGIALMKLAILDPMVVDVDVPPSVVNVLHRGDAALVRLPGSSADRSGRVVTIAPLPGEAGAHAVEVEFQNPSAALFAGQPARVRFGGAAAGASK
jgi:multidrug resistance efflux pump